MEDVAKSTSVDHGMYISSFSSIKENFLFISNQRNMGQHLVQKQRKNSGVIAGADVVEGR